ncbi:DUF736 family protein [Leptospira bandrabouensis]|uniref:DUF736 family protein n=1 Tax=Leptospira bandrabouensis TaxID=2484903 RepID=UPI001EEB7BE6|nr:DUF736 family protein [Leptospira bandrabouensis]MCG6152618.1 DUF736 family protein [Leptospira bandrabouensis]
MRTTLEDFTLAFKGEVLSPMKIRNLKGYKNLFSENEKNLIEAKIEEAKTDVPLGNIPVNPRTEVRNNQLNKGVNSMLQNVGFLKQKSKKEGAEAVYDLEINLPFHPQQTFYVVEHTTKEKEGQPDFSIFHARHKVGSIWRRVSEKKGTKFLSGNIFALGVASHTNNKTGTLEPILQFNIFESKGKNSEETQQVVCVSYGEQKADDPEEPF